MAMNRMNGWRLVINDISKRFYWTLWLHYSQQQQPFFFTQAAAAVALAFGMTANVRVVEDGSGIDFIGCMYIFI